MSETHTTHEASPCDACGSPNGPLLKMSLGRDFFGRVYDRLSPSSDQSPKWYCETCSMHKNLQRDYRDIRAEFDKWQKGQASELSAPDQMQRARLRLMEIVTILGGHAGSRLLDPADVAVLLNQLHARADVSPLSH